MTQANTYAPSRALRALLLRILVGQSVGPERIYVGLLTEYPGPDVSLEFLESIEVEGPGYQRLPVTPQSWEVSETPTQALAEVTFHNSGSTSWRNISAMFLATSQGALGQVVTVVPMRFGSHDLPPGGSIRVPITLDM